VASVPVHERHLPGLLCVEGEKKGIEPDPSLAPFSSFPRSISLSLSRARSHGRVGLELAVAVAPPLPLLFQHQPPLSSSLLPLLLAAICSFVVLGRYLTGIKPASSIPFSVFRRCEEEGPSSEAETLCCVHFAKVLETKDLHIGAYMICGKFCVHSA
jgi:hypothetical protein